ncbi:hypothetical protein NKG94_41195 [Micromonospora sp. M12]
MTDEPFAVRPKELRAVAVLLDDEAHRLALGLAGSRGWWWRHPSGELTRPWPGWRRPGTPGSAGWAPRSRRPPPGWAAAEAYEAVDDRAADRFAALPR